MLKYKIPQIVTLTRFPVPMRFREGFGRRRRTKEEAGYRAVSGLSG